MRVLLGCGAGAPTHSSVAAGDGVPFLSFRRPPPARYVPSPKAFARRLLQPVLELREGGAVSQRTGRLMPQFVRGASIGPAPSHA